MSDAIASKSSGGPATLKEILITSNLNLPSRPPDLYEEGKAQRPLGRPLATEPCKMFSKLGRATRKSPTRA